LPSITLVTGILDLGRGAIDGWGRRPYAFYTASLARLMRRYRNTPMVLHVAPSDEPLIRHFRKPENTLVVPISLEALRAMPYRQRVEAIRTSTRWVDGADWLRDSPQHLLEGYLPFVLAKPYWLRDVAISNPFRTNHFVWMDGGLVDNPTYAHLARPNFLRKMDLSSFGVVGVPYTSNEEIHGFERKACARYCNTDFVSWIVRGGLFGGAPAAIEQVAELYTALMDDTLAHGHLGTEETLLTILAHRHPDLLQRRMLSPIGIRLRSLSGAAALAVRKLRTGPEGG
jgi:hypothetical protein